MDDKLQNGMDFIKGMFLAFLGFLLFTVLMTTEPEGFHQWNEGRRIEQTGQGYSETCKKVHYGIEQEGNVFRWYKNRVGERKSYQQDINQSFDRRDYQRRKRQERNQYDYFEAGTGY